MASKIRVKTKKPGKKKSVSKDNSQMTARQKYKLEQQRLKGNRSQDYYKHKQEVARIRSGTTKTATRTTGATTVGASSINQMEGKEEVNDTLLTGGVGSTHNTNIYISDSKKVETDDENVTVNRKTRTD